MISKRMKYALKALITITQQPTGLIAAHCIAEKSNIPLKFLEQILTELRKGRIVNSKKGSAGGYYLMRPPQEISLAEVYRLIEGPIALMGCVSIHFYEPCADCPNEAECSIRQALLQVRDESLKVLQKMTIHDLANHHPLPG